jgi:hypothetical protein
LGAFNNFLYSFSNIYGSGIFSDPLGLEWLLLATAAGVWRLRDGHTPRLIETPEALAARETAERKRHAIAAFTHRGRFGA